MLRIAFIVVAMIAFSSISNAATIYIKIHITDGCGTLTYHYVRLGILDLNTQGTVCDYQTVSLVAGDNYISYDCDVPSERGCSYKVLVSEVCDYNPITYPPSLSCCNTTPQLSSSCFTFSDLYNSGYIVNISISL